ncbi:MAG: hypothetical protein M3N95_09070 [Actinomycetota bacterium]|nr:hypothetical protein [Actinomycetota bacterium]
MARHAKRTDGRWRFARGGALTLIWLGGLAAGFLSILAAAARYSCAPTAHGLACRPAGTAAGGGLIIAVIAIVTAVTVTTHDTGRRRLAAWTFAGATALLGCYVGARALIGTA